MVNKRFSVLIAYNSIHDSFLLKDAMVRHAPGLNVIGEVSSGKNAIEYLAGKGDYSDRTAHPFPDLLVLDVQIPLVDGLAVVEWVQTHEIRRLTIAMMTDASFDEYKERALRLGIVHFHSKGFRDGLPSLVKHFQKEMEKGQTDRFI